MGYIESLRQIVGHRPIITCGAAVVIRRTVDDAVLLQERPDGAWGLPGGLMELGESLEDTARREVREETQLSLGHLSLLGVFSGPDYHTVLGNGDEIYTVTAVFGAGSYTGTPVPDGTEGRSVAFWPRIALPRRLRGHTADFLAVVGPAPGKPVKTVSPGPSDQL